MSAPDNRTKATNNHDRFDLLHIARIVPEGSRVLDVGCGDGALLDLLVSERNADARGLEISREGVNACVARGLSVVQGDADTDLDDYPTGGFDYVILSQTLQATHRTRHVVEQMLRIGRHAVVSFPNFGYWRVVLQLVLRGRMPNTATLDNPWHATPNIHLCTVKDFVDLAHELEVDIESFLPLNRRGTRAALAPTLGLANFFADQAIFVLRRRNQ